jgi:rhodanese-related sulfurtransferase
LIISEITVDELASRLDAGAALFDVRELDEWEQARVPGVQLIPLATVPDQVGRFPDGEDVLLICRSGARSMAAAEFLAQRGKVTVNIAGGTNAWIASGRAIDSGPSAE